MLRVSRTPKFPVLLAALVLLAPTLGMLAVGAPAEAADGALNLDQCANGGTGSTATNCVDGWENGNLNHTKAHYAEGDSVPYRLRFSGLYPGTWKIEIAWDTLKGTDHALDYLATYNRTVTNADPCSGAFLLCGVSTDTFNIPKDTVSPAPDNQIPGVFTMFGADITGVSAYTHSGEETSITITFTTFLVSSPVLAWGGHIATRTDWGPGNSAGAISGSPYHMRAPALTDPLGRIGPGNQDRSLASSAVIAPASVTVVKVAAPKGPQTFQFTTLGLTPSTFALADDGDTSPPHASQVISDIRDFTNSKTITETAVAGWTLTSATCTGLTNPASKSENRLTMTLSEADDAICTFTNVKNPTITAIKTADPTSVAEPGGPVTFSVSVKNESTVENVTLTTLNDVPYGNVAVKAGNVLDTTCAVPQTIAPGATYLCSFKATVAGDSNSSVRDVLTATANDVRNVTLTDDDDAIVAITDVKPLLQVDKSVSPGQIKEPGGIATYKVDVKNLSKEELTLTTLNDDKFGPLAGKGNCTVGQKIAPGATYTCTFDQQVNGPPGTSHVNTITGKATDNENNEVTDLGDAKVEFTDVVPKLVVDKSVSPSKLPEPGGKVTYTVVVTNPQDAVESIDLTALVDDRFGNLNGQGTCNVSKPVPLAPGAKYTCTFDKELTGNAKATHLNTVTATIKDDDGNTISNKDDALVEFTDALPKIEVEKTADPVTVPEPGGDVTFAVKVINPLGAAEPVEIVSLIDNVYGSLAGKGSCLPAATTLILAPGGVYSCSFTVFVSGQPDETKTDTIVGKAKDDEGNPAEDSASASVTITDVLPEVVVDKTADPTSVPETGGPVTFTVRVTNPATAVESILLSELTDSAFGDLNGKGNCDVTPPVTLGIGGEYVCTFTRTIKGDFPEVHTNTVTAAATDDEENRDTATDDADVTLTDVIPTILVDKAALPDTLPEPGGDVTYAVSVTNTSLETVTLTQLVDDAGSGAVSLAGKGDCLADPPVTILPGKTYNCTFTAPVNGDAKSVHTDTVTATAEDDEKHQVTNQDSATVTITDVPPAIVVDKGAAPSEIAEPGGTVNFTVAVTNASTVEAVTLTSLVDDVYGNLDGKGTCNLATAGPIAIGGHYTCTFPGAVSGNAGSTHDDTVTAVAQDNDGTSTPPVTDKATVTILNVAPKIVVNKFPFPSKVDEPGGTVNFTVTVTNPGTAEELTLTSLNDDVYGNLNGKGTCQVPQTIATGGQYQCTFPGEVKGDAGSTHTDTVTAAAKDDEDNEVSDAARATVTVIDVKPAVLVAKSAAPSTLPEPGGTATFTVTVTNPANAVESITLTSLLDNVFGSLNGEGKCAVPQDLAPGAHYTCSFTGPVTGNGGSTHTNEVTGTATDNEGNKAIGRTRRTSRSPTSCRPSRWTRPPGPAPSTPVTP